MTELRIAHPRETGPQKVIWKQCFGDENIYIERYFQHRYRPEETVLALEDGTVASMLTMLPVGLHRPDGAHCPAAMIYAVGTHPDFRGRGLANRAMDFADAHLAGLGVPYTLLVPASPSLFDFYGRRGYVRCFQMRERAMEREEIAGLIPGEGCTLAPADAGEYNALRAGLLAGRLYVSHSDEDLAYQKLTSQASGCDLYRLHWKGQSGCAVAERHSPNRVAVKELLLPCDAMLPAALAALARTLSAQSYWLRLPEFLGKGLGGDCRFLGMVKPTGGESGFLPKGLSGYLGICFD